MHREAQPGPEEIQARYGGDMGEIHARYGGDMGEIWGRSLAVHREAQLGPEAVAHVLELLGAVGG